MPRSTRRSTSPSTQHHNTEDRDPDWFWDGEDASFPRWDEEIEEHIYLQDESFRFLIQYGAKQDGGSSKTINCISEEHAYQVSIDNIVEGTWAEPNDGSRLRDGGKNLTLARADEAKRAANDKDAVRPVFDTSVFKVNPPTVVLAKTRLATEIFLTITNKQLKKDLKKTHTHDGFRLLPAFATIGKELGREIAEQAEEDIISLRNRGLASSKVTDFDEFRNEYEFANDRRASGRKEAPHNLAAAYLAAARDLGEQIRLKIDMKLVLAKISDADIETKLDPIVKLIRAELNAETRSSRGRTLFSGEKRGDPPKQSLRKGDRTPSPSSREKKPCCWTVNSKGESVRKWCKTHDELCTRCAKNNKGNSAAG